MITSRRSVLLGAALLVTVTVGGTAAASTTPPADSEPAASEAAGTEAAATIGELEQTDITLGLIPIADVAPVFIALERGIFEDYGLNVTTEFAAGGAAAIPALQSGDIDMAWSPTPPVIVQISNAGVPLVGVYGMPNPDWVIGTTEAGKTCKDMAGQDVGVDSINGARSIALRSMLAAGCK